MRRRVRACAERPLTERTLAIFFDARAVTDAGEVIWVVVKRRSKTTPGGHV